MAEKITCLGVTLGIGGTPSYSLLQRLDTSLENLGPSFLDIYNRSEVIQPQHSAIVYER